MINQELAQSILNYVHNTNYRPVKPKVIAKKLGLVGPEAREVRRTIKKLVQSKQLAFGSSHLVMRVVTGKHVVKQEDRPGPKTNSGEVIGVLKMASAGFGFVTPNTVADPASREADIFIPEHKTADAINRDVVKVKISNFSGRNGKAEGEIVEVLERSKTIFVGTYFESGGKAYVQVDGKVLPDPVSVGDPGSVLVEPDDKVVIEMVRFPTKSMIGEGVITQVLGQRGEPSVDTMSVIYEFDLPQDFSEATMEDARQQATLFDASISEGRKDLTKEIVCTIDPKDARDFDDAISLEPIENGHWILGVHIADVSHFVPEKSALDAEAYDRATSVYLPDRVIPMLPEIISNNLASLQPGKVRYAMTAKIEFNAEGVPIATKVFKSAIKSSHRFTYEEIDSYLENPESWKEKIDPQVHALVGNMHTLAMKLRKRRFTRGSLELSMPETKIDLDKDGRVCGAHLTTNTESHQIIEEFMLTANEAVAEFLFSQGMIFLRRVHPEPDSSKLKALNDFMDGIGIHNIESLENRFALQKLLTDLKGDPRETAANFAILRSMKRAIYSPEEEGHYALASKCYCHFTSPIRRYPDLTIHRMVDKINRGIAPVQDPQVIFAQGDHCSGREQRASGAERELNRLKLLNYLADKVGLEMEGTITGVENFGIFVIGQEIPAEGFIHISALGSDRFRYDKDRREIVGHRFGNKFRLGDKVKVVVASVNVDKRELDFKIIGHSESTVRRTKAGKSKRPIEVKRPKKYGPPKESRGKGKKGRGGGGRRK